MPRKPRMFLPDYPCHIIQRGNNRDATFYSEQDYLFYLHCLKEAADRYQLAVHSYVLMTNHVHILATPEDATSVSRAMQSLGRRYVQYINKEYRRSGTLWEGRYKSSLVDAENYLFKCYRYIEMNPVAANMVSHPIEYRWSSYHHNAAGSVDDLITPHGLYESLSIDPTERRSMYKALFDTVLDNNDIRVIRTAAACSMPIGGSRFKDQIEAALERKLGCENRGRPKRVAAE